MKEIPFKNTYANLPERFFAKVNPTPVSNPKVLLVNSSLAEELGIDPQSLTEEILSGQKIPHGAQPIAMAYSGHQFGHFNPTLGDGRAILLGEVAGHDVQLKGSGLTPFSRQGDGRSALGPVLREYLVSEAMHALGVSTTRALAAVCSGEQVLRESSEPGGILTRVAKSHLRIGTVQYFASRGDYEGVEILIDYLMKRHYPFAKNALEVFEEIVRRQAQLIAHWMSLGFIHGVMNTDNMSLSGETIDYGPCAFMDRYNPSKHFSFIDRQGRYSYQNQPSIAQWNLARLAEALLPLFHQQEDQAVHLAKEVLNEFTRVYEANYQQRFSAKLGFSDHGDPRLIESLLKLMSEQEADFTLVFRHLSEDPDQFLSQFADPTSAKDWFKEWQKSAKANIELMRASNPIFIPRNHRIEQVIEAAKKDDFTLFYHLHEILQNPFLPQEQNSSFEMTPKPGEVVCHTFCGT